MRRAWPSAFLVLLLIGCGNDPAGSRLSPDQGQVMDVWQAATLGRLEPLKAAMARGIDLNALNQDGWAPLHLAVVANQVAAVEWLLKHGVRINAETAGLRSALDIALTPGFKPTRQVINFFKALLSKIVGGRLARNSVITVDQKRLIEI